MARNRTDMQSLVNSAKEICSRFADEGIPYIIVGSVAVHLHGAPRRDGDDIDFFVGKGSEPKAIQVIEDMGFMKDGKYYRNNKVKVEIKSDGFGSYPDLNSPNECVVINGVRVPTIVKLIDTKVEACRDVLNKVVSHGVGGPRRRNTIIRQASDLVDLVKILGSRRRSQNQ